MKDCEKKTIDRAITWWKSLRPCAWTSEAHLKEPAVNTCTDRERRLALAVAEVVRNRRK